MAVVAVALAGRVRGVEAASTYLDIAESASADVRCSVTVPPGVVHGIDSKILSCLEVGESVHQI